MERLASPIAWEYLLRRKCKGVSQISPKGMQYALAAMAVSGVQQYLANRSPQKVLEQLGIQSSDAGLLPGVAAVAVYARDKLLQDPSNSGLTFALQKHPHRLEIVALVTLRAISPLLAEQGRKRGIEHRFHPVWTSMHPPFAAAPRSGVCYAAKQR